MSPRLPFPRAESVVCCWSVVRPASLRTVLWVQMPPYSSSPPSSGGLLGEPSREVAKRHRTATRAAWVPGVAGERVIFDPDADSDREAKPQLYREFSSSFGWQFVQYIERSNGETARVQRCGLLPARNSGRSEAKGCACTSP